MNLEVALCDWREGSCRPWIRVLEECWRGGRRRVLWTALMKRAMIMWGGRPGGRLWFCPGGGFTYQNDLRWALKRELPDHGATRVNVSEIKHRQVHPIFAQPKPKSNPSLRCVWLYLATCKVYNDYYFFLTRVLYDSKIHLQYF